MIALARQRATQLLRLVAAPLLLGGIVWLAGPQAVLAAVRTADPRWLAAGLVLAVGGNAGAALRWRELARWLGHRVGAHWALAVYFRGVAVNALLPGAVVGGDMLRAWQLHRDGCAKSAAGLSVVLDRLSGLWILFVLAAAALFAGLGSAEMDTLRRVLQIPAAWPTGAIAAALVLGFLTLPWLGLVATAVLVGHRALPGSRRATAVGLLQRPDAAQQYAVQCATSLVTQLLSVGGLYCASRAFGVSLPAWLVAFTAAPIFLLAALPVSFGGWGTREVATVTGWAVFGIAAPQAVATAATVGIYALLQAVLGLLPIPASKPMSSGASGAGNAN